MPRIGKPIARSDVARVQQVRGFHPLLELPDGRPIQRDAGARLRPGSAASLLLRRLRRGALVLRRVPARPHDGPRGHALQPLRQRVLRGQRRHHDGLPVRPASSRIGRGGGFLCHAPRGGQRQRRPRRLRRAGREAPIVRRGPQRKTRRNPGQCPEPPMDRDARPRAHGPLRERARPANAGARPSARAGTSGSTGSPIATEPLSASALPTRARSSPWCTTARRAATTASSSRACA